MPDRVSGLTEQQATELQMLDDELDAHIAQLDSGSLRRFAADCALRVVALYEQVYPHDERPRLAAEHRWTREGTTPVNAHDDHVQRDAEAALQVARQAARSAKLRFIGTRSEDDALTALHLQAAMMAAGAATYVGQLDAFAAAHLAAWARCSTASFECIGDVPFGLFRTERVWQLQRLRELVEKREEH